MHFIRINNKKKPIYELDNLVFIIIYIFKLFKLTPFYLHICNYVYWCYYTQTKNIYIYVFGKKKIVIYN